MNRLAEGAEKDDEEEVQGVLLLLLLLLKLEIEDMRCAVVFVVGEDCCNNMARLELSGIVGRGLDIEGSTFDDELNEDELPRQVLFPLATLGGSEEERSLIPSPEKEPFPMLQLPLFVQ